MATQGRLRGLLRATQMINGGLTLPVVLHRIAEAARELVGARYAALGVLAPDGGLAEFVHTGMPPELVARIGHLPQGKGLLGALIENPEPIRLARISDDPRSCGFPPGHPPMTSFLGVPVRVRDEVFGNLYLAESTRGAFNADDEELTRALAATAGSSDRQRAPLRGGARPRRVAARLCRHHPAAALGRPRRRRAAAAHRRARVRGRPRRPRHRAAPRPRRTARPPRRDGRGDGGDRPGRRASAGRRVATRAGVHDRHADADRQPGRAGRGCGRWCPTGWTPGRRWWCRCSGAAAWTACSWRCGGAAGPRSPPRTSRWRPASPTRPLWRSSWRGPVPTGIARRCSTSASGSPRTCTTTSSNGCSPAACRCRPLRPRSAPGRPPTGSWVPSPTSTPRSRQIRTAIFQLQQVPSATPRGLRARLLDVVTDVTPALGFDPAVRFAGLIDTLPDAASRRSARRPARGTDEHRTARPRHGCGSGDHRHGPAAHRRGSGRRGRHRRHGPPQRACPPPHRAERHGGTLDLGPPETGSGDPAGTRLTWSIPLGEDDLDQPA